MTSRPSGGACGSCPTEVQGPGQGNGGNGGGEPHALHFDGNRNNYENALCSWTCDMYTISPNAPLPPNPPLCAPHRTSLSIGRKRPRLPRVALRAAAGGLVAPAEAALELAL